MNDFSQFEPQKFVTRVLEACHFQKLPEEILQNMKESLEKEYMDRLFAVMYAELDAEQVQRYQRLLEQHPERFSFDLLLEVGKTIPHLEEIVSHASDVLFLEWTQNADVIRDLMNH